MAAHERKHADSAERIRTRTTDDTTDVLQPTRPARLAHADGLHVLREYTCGCVVYLRLGS